MNTYGSNTSRRWREPSTRKDWPCSEPKINTETRTKVIVEELSKHLSAQATTLFTLLMATATGLLINLNRPHTSLVTVTLSWEDLSVPLLVSLTIISNCKAILPLRIKEITLEVVQVKKKSSPLWLLVRCAPRNTRNMRKRMRKKPISSYLVVVKMTPRKLYCQLTEAVLSNRKTLTWGHLRV